MEYNKDKDEQLLLTLTQRLLSSPYAGGPAEEIQILVGRLPPAQPIELPLPEKARIIGSLVRGDHGVQIVLDVDQPADAVVTFYRAQLEPAGWQEFDWPMRPGGFGLGWVIFCQSRRGPSLTVSAFEAEGAWTDVRLNLQTDPHQSPCAMPDRAYGRITSPIPNLRAPGCTEVEVVAAGGIAGTRPQPWKPASMPLPWPRITGSNCKLPVGNSWIKDVPAPRPGVPGASETTKEIRGPAPYRSLMPPERQIGVPLTCTWSCSHEGGEDRLVSPLGGDTARMTSPPR
jgi:hypothetical protein